MPPDDVARKALRVNLSDLAAKGATPLGFLLSLALPKDDRRRWLPDFAEGLRGDAVLFGCPLFGGDTDRTPGPITISIAMFGSVPEGTMVRRAGAKPGDRVFVSGTIGDAALGLAVAQGRRLETERGAAPASWRRAICCRSRATRWPRPCAQHASAAMDVSDGLAGDFAKLCRASQVGAGIDGRRACRCPTPPRRCWPPMPAMLETALTGGDDYEIVCTVPPAKAEASAPRRRRPKSRSPRSATSRRARAPAFSAPTASR